MSRREYTQTVKPVSRIPEKIFGWLAWLPLLALTLYSLYLLLVNGNDPNFISDMKSAMTDFINDPQNSEMRDALNDNNMSVDDLIPMMVAGLKWMLAYTLIPLVLGLIGLLSMKKRILAGIMFLLAGLFSAPLFLTVILGFIPLFFFIAAILLFVRKDKVITNDDYYNDRREVETYERDRKAAPVYVDRDENIEREKENDYVYDADRERTVVTEERKTDSYEDHANDTYKDNNYKESNEIPVRRDTVIEEEEHHYTNNDVDSKQYQGHVDHDYNASSDNVTYDDRGDRVKFVDKTVDPVDERRENYNNRMNRDNDLK